MIITIIPARGNSKRVKRKNLKLFSGNPLIYWSIKSALSCPSLKKNVWVSTEDKEIADLSENFGASVIKRPLNLCTDNTSTYEVIFHATQIIKEKINFNAVMTLQPTNPFRSIKIIEDAIKHFINNKCDSLISITKRRLKIGEIRNKYFYKKYESEQQSRLTDPTYYENGLIYISLLKTLEKFGCLYGKNILPYETNLPYHDIDLDDDEDFVYGEILFDEFKTKLFKQI